MHKAAVNGETVSATALEEAMRRLSFLDDVVESSFVLYGAVLGKPFIAEDGEVFVAVKIGRASKDSPKVASRALKAASCTLEDAVAASTSNPPSATWLDGLPTTDQYYNALKQEYPTHQDNDSRLGVAVHRDYVTRPLRRIKCRVLFCTQAPSVHNGTKVEAGVRQRLGHKVIATRGLAGDEWAMVPLTTAAKFFGAEWADFKALMDAQRHTLRITPRRGTGPAAAVRATRRDSKTVKVSYGSGTRSVSVSCVDW